MDIKKRIENLFLIFEIVNNRLKFKKNIII
jgi:hypothetical protein